MNAPNATPWKKVATSEPPMKALSQTCWRALLALKRNSKATPRNISPISMKMIGRYSADSTTE